MKIDKPNIGKDLIWNYISIIILALSGTVFNAIIIWFYNPEALGVFNQVYAYYIVLSQVCVWGVHMSVGQSIPLLLNNKKEQKVALTTAIFVVALISCVVVMIVYFIIRIHDSAVAISFVYVLPAIVIFSINKVILNFFNGISAMRIYAVLQSLRSFSIAIGILMLAWIGAGELELSKCFLIGELLVLLVGIFLLLNNKSLSFKISNKWVKKHLIFGSEIILSNLVLELNTKIDIMCLGWILKDDYLIGIYSFAVLFAEGFYQVFVVIRRNINPYIATNGQKKENRTETIRRILDDTKKIVQPLRVFGPMIISVAYVILCVILRKTEYVVGVWMLLIICVFIAIVAQTIILGNYFSQIEKPVIESIINAVAVISNLVGNVILISIMGLYGAALATGISYVCFAVLLQIFIKKEEKNKI